MAVEHAGFRRRQRADAEQFRLQRARGIAADQFEPLDAIGLALHLERLDPGKFFRIGGHNELAALIMGDTMRGAELVEHAPAAGRVASPQRAGRIIDAGMDHLAVARRDAVADTAGRFGDDHFMAAQRRGAGDR